MPPKPQGVLTGRLRRVVRVRNGKGILQFGSEHGRVASTRSDVVEDSQYGRTCVSVGHHRNRCSYRHHARERLLAARAASLFARRCIPEPRYEPVVTAYAIGKCTMAHSTPVFRKHGFRILVKKEIEPMSAKRLTILACVGLLVSPLGGCGPEPQPPSPTVNPHPHEFTKLKITVEPGSGVTGVKVESLWTVGNIGCAPHEGWPSGASITKQVNTPEKVEQVGANEWIATVIDDRFLPDKCRWIDGAYNINFMNGNTILSYGGADQRNFTVSNVLNLTCEAQAIVPPAPPICTVTTIFVRNMERNFKDHHYKVFTATVEIVK